MLKKLRLAAVIALAGALYLSGCTGDKNDSEQITIGVTQFMEHPSLDAAFNGFKKAIEDAGLEVEYDVQMGHGDQNTLSAIANNFVGDKVDLIFANSTPSAQTALKATKDIPIVFTSVTDPIGAKLVNSMEEPGGNATGTIDNHPDAIKKMVAFIHEQFDVKDLGTIYNAGEQNSRAQIDLVKHALKGTGIKLYERSVSTTSEVKQAAESLIGKVDAIYIVTDNTVVSGLDAVIKVAEEEDIPLFVGELDSVAKGGFAAFGFKYDDIGYRAGEMAAQILKGEKTPAEIPVEYPPNLKLVLNKKAAAKMNIEWKDEWNDLADEIIE